MPARVIVPADAPRAKLDRIEALGAEVVPVTHEEWWQAMVERGRDGVDGLFVAPVADEAVMAGNGTIGARALRGRAGVRHGRHPVGRRRADDRDRERAESAAAGRSCRDRRARDRCAAGRCASPPVGRREIDFRPSWVDGAGGRALLPGMWERARELVDDAVAVPLAEVEEAVRLLAARVHVVAEGAGALALAAALKRDDRCVCIVSGGNIDLDVLSRILAGAA